MVAYSFALLAVLVNLPNPPTGYAAFLKPSSTTFGYTSVVLREILS
jgi:hypothetical protein